MGRKGTRDHLERDDSFCPACSLPGRWEGLPRAVLGYGAVEVAAQRSHVR